MIKEPFFNGPFVPKKHIEKPIHTLPPKDEAKIIFKNIPLLQKNKNTPKHSPTNTVDNDMETQ